MNPLAFVGKKSEITLQDLKELLQSLSGHYFLRWPHKVSWENPDFQQDLSLEGQVFNTQRELRWKKRGSNYDVLLLSIDGLDADFKIVGESWNYCDRPAQFIRNENQRFPKSLTYPNIKIAQRYFIDSKTGTVQFVALTIKV